MTSAYAALARRVPGTHCLVSIYSPMYLASIAFLCSHCVAFVKPHTMKVCYHSDFCMKAAPVHTTTKIQPIHTR